MKIKDGFHRNIKRMGLKLKKHSPEILITAGVVGTVTSTVLACRATLKVNDILQDSKEQLDKIHTVRNDEKYSEQYTEEDARKDTTVVYVQTGIKLVKLYAPAAILGTLSVASILTSNNILRKRNIALGAAYAAVDKSFKEYRSRVMERFGETVDKELHYNIKSKDISDEATTDENSEKRVASPDYKSEFAQVLDKNSRYWDKNFDVMLNILSMQQNLANDMLRANGHLFLNEVYDLLDLPRTKAGQIVGWIYDPKNNIKNDNYVDFGICCDPDIRYFGRNDYLEDESGEQAILLDFNVDGNILDLI